MTTEILATVAAPATATDATDNPASEQVDETQTTDPVEPGNTDPSEDEAVHEAEETPAEKAIRKMERRIARLTADRGGRDEKIRQLEAELHEVKQAKEATEQVADPEKLAETLANQKVAQREAYSAADKLMKQARAKFGAGFDAKVAAVAHEVGPLMLRTGLLHPLLDAIVDSDKSVDLLAHITDDEELAAELYVLSPAKLGRRIANLERELEAAAKPKPSGAAKPLTPVKPSAPVTVDPAKLSDRQWAEQRRKERLGA